MTDTDIIGEYYFNGHDGRMGAARRGDSVVVIPELQKLWFCVLLTRDGCTYVGHTTDPSMPARPIAAEKLQNHINSLKENNV